MAEIGMLLGQIALGSARSMTAPLFWTLGDQMGVETMKNGSIFFLDAGHGVFGVTAAHVVGSYMQDSANPLFRRCMIARHERAPYPVDLRGRVIEQHEGMDIATLRFTETEISEIGTTIVRQSDWPPPLAHRNSIITYGGWPGVGRAWVGPTDLGFGSVFMQGPVTNSHETCISIHIDRSAAQLRQVLGDKPMPPNFDFGGMSGGPALSLRKAGDYRAWILEGPSWTLVGVVFAGPNPCSDTTQSISDFEVISIRPAHFIRSNGTLDVERWDASQPW